MNSLGGDPEEESEEWSEEEECREIIETILDPPGLPYQNPVS